MKITIRKYIDKDIPYITRIWNNVVEEAKAFPQIEKMSEKEAEIFFASQSFTAVAVCDDQVLGLYILHPNNIGRCSHIANASYAVGVNYRGGHIGEKLVRHSMDKARKLNFSILQFNAVVSTNQSAIHLYEKIGFNPIGSIPDGYLLGDGRYTDIKLYYISLI
ncbi:GNAT family N-acetyltransferase [Clostridium tyrobutyricum]|uniref:GNAT family N-acetyltransferase n=1 Tax=Clostridium tyrobutyricum TaxID=1519 RepID=UPI001C385436|nr:GNAT family N-acetyltransferase [Clostridium tyrobutyricum]MBV4418408.1 GNAT family N-acetyltransferase [Clostridium tyrobutyricum]